ncbi:MAG TPA: hypothetical protein VFK20_09485 [Vicinamibacterales bacterium]|nr:hypothetical protein [Vicinamibacterales bacterium]
MRSIALAMSFVAGLGVGVEQANATGRVVLTLRSQTVWQRQAWCTLTAELEDERGALSYRCGGGRERRRTLTPSETTKLRRLYEAANLFDGGHIGADHTDSDVPCAPLP